MKKYIIKSKKTKKEIKYIGYISKDQKKHLEKTKHMLPI
mgnify:CR=1 FL=1|tara:strand:- start:144 stop:260 length:117 start_codon:yes stop_codon:yes gene_type:complete